MKIDRHGQAKILTQSEIQLLFSHVGESNDGSYVGKLMYDDLDQKALPERSNNIHQQLR